MDAGMKKARIVVIGSGVVGSSIAYFLGRKGITDVVVIETERNAGVHSSGRSNSNFIHLFDPPTMVQYSFASEEFLYNTPREFSEHPLAVSNGAVITVSEAGLERHRSEVAYARDLGIEVREIDITELKQLVPILKTEGMAGAAYYPKSGPIDASTLLSQYIRHARAAGVRFEYDCAFLGVAAKGRAVTAVSTTKGDIACDVLVNAAGAWAGVVGELAGASPIAFSAKRRHLISTRLPPEMAGYSGPFVRCNSIPMYFKIHNGNIVASPMDEDEVEPQDCQTDELRVAEIGDAINAHTSVPIRRIDHSWAGLRTFSKDRMLVMGFDPQLEGFFWAAGQGGTGIQTSPCFGDLGARLISGEASREQFPEMDPGRFFGV